MTLYQQWCLRKAQIKRKRLFSHYSPEARVLEVGSGNAALSYLMQQEGLSVTALDVKNKSIFPSVHPVIYDGEVFPFEDNSFEVVQMITMLHHTPDPVHIIKEAQRVGRELIIMEDIYSNPLQKHLTFFADSLNNWEFKGHPHTNKTDEQWREVFDSLNLKIERVEYYPFLLLFKQVTYWLK